MIFAAMMSETVSPAASSDAYDASIVLRLCGCGTSFRIDSALTLFPLPDSPTTASVSPAFTS